MKTFSITYTTRDGKRVGDCTYATEADLVERVVQLMTSDFHNAIRVELTLGMDAPDVGEMTGFHLEGSPVWMGVDSGQNWNGWACPMFDRATMETILVWWTENVTKPIGDPPSYFDEDGHLHLFYEGQDPDDPDAWEICSPDENGLYYWGGGYCWSHAGDEPACGYRENFSEGQEAHLQMEADGIIDLLNGEIALGRIPWDVRSMQEVEDLLSGTDHPFDVQDMITIDPTLWPGMPMPGDDRESPTAYEEFFDSFVTLVVAEIDDRMAYPGFAVRAGKKVLDQEMTAEERIAVEFSKILVDWLGLPTMHEVVKRNATPEYENACASHDFCDANEAMLEACETIGFPMKWEEEDGMEAAEAWTDIVNRSWDIAKDKEFYLRLISTRSL